MIEILERSGDSHPPEFFNSHPSPEHRLAILQKLAVAQPPGARVDETQLKQAVGARQQATAPAAADSR